MSKSEGEKSTEEVVEKAVEKAFKDLVSKKDIEKAIERGAEKAIEKKDKTLDRVFESVPPRDAPIRDRGHDEQTSGGGGDPEGHDRFGGGTGRNDRNQGSS